MSSTNKNEVKQKKTGSGGFLKSLRTELKKVTWPTKKELINYEVVVISFSVLAALAIWIFDMSFSKIIGQLLMM
ncbi:MAG: preprotein translocase subunit SecE [Bacillota bacterium]|nr:preprotein translocase subunit SecE [Bacillota bacterium]